MNLTVIVEGQGEENAVRLLVRRIATELFALELWTLPHTIRVSRGTILHRPDELRRYLGLAANKAGEQGSVLILVDGDKDCPAQLGPQLLRTAQALRTDLRLSVVVATQEYEAWFIAAAESLGLPHCESPEDVRDGKGWLTRARGSKYSPTADQASLTMQFDLEQARSRSDSFDKLCRELHRLLG